jgi:transposase
VWTSENRCRYDRSHLRYESDLNETKWSEVWPLIPPAKRGGNKRTVDIRQVTNGVRYILQHRVSVARHPEGFASEEHGPRDLVRWAHDGTLERLHHALYVKCREQAAREASPTAAIIDAQSVKSAEKGGAWIDPHGYDPGKKIKGKKRHVLVDTQGFVLRAIVTVADIQDRDGGAMLLATLFGMFPFLLKLYADGDYMGPGFQKALKPPVPGRSPDRQTIRPPKRLRRAAEAMGRGTHPGLAQQMPQTGKGLGEPQPEGARLLAPRLNQTHGQKALPNLKMFPDRL